MAYAKMWRGKCETLLKQWNKRLVAHVVRLVILTFRRQRQDDHHMFESSLLYVVSSRPDRAISWDSTSKAQNKEKRKKLKNAKIRLQLYETKLGNFS